MRLFFLFLLVAVVATRSHAQIQHGHEIGGGIGMLTYSGDLSPSFRLPNSRPAITFLYRYSLSSVVTVRTNFIYGALGAKEVPLDAFAAKRDASFRVNVVEFSPEFEYHFLPWREKRAHRFTPYIHAGLGIFGITKRTEKPKQYSDIQLCIPFGVGVKWVINPHYYVALEFGNRKTFFDYIDNVSEGNTVYKNYQYGNPYDYDSYYYTGFTLSYTFYEILCPHSPYRKKY